VIDQTLDQRIGLPDAAEPAKEHDRAVTDPGHGLDHRWHDLVDHFNALHHPLVPAKAGTQN